MKPEKCKIHKTTVRYLGLIISTKGISMDEDEVETVRNGRREKKTASGSLNNLFEEQQFIGFRMYSPRFISNYSDRVVPLTRLTKKDQPFVWGAEQQLAFETMVEGFTTAPILRHYNHEREVIIATVASDYVSARVLSQYDEEGVLHPVAFISTNHSLAECNYDIYDTELMACIKALEVWRPECDGAAYHLQLMTDRTNLDHLMTKKLLNR